MSQKVHHRVKPLGILLGTLLLGAAWFALLPLLHPLTTQLYTAAVHRMGQPAEVQPQLLREGEAPQMHPVTTRETVWESPTVGMVELNDAACEQCFAALPLGPQDLAVLLNRLREGGAETVGVSSSLTWQQAPGDMAREMLCRVFGSFPHSAIGLRGRTAAQADFTPLVLRETVIPADCVSGDATGLPIANKPLPNGLTEVPDSLQITWAPDWLQDEPLTHKPAAVEDMSFPLLVRWNGETIPTLPLRLALDARGLTPSDVTVELGKCIRFGGLTLPLDEHGRTRLQRAKTVNLPLADVVKGEPLPPQLGEHPAVVLEQPAEGQNTPQRLERLAQTLSELAAVPHEEVSTHDESVGGMVLREKPLLSGWGAYTLAAVALLLSLWLLPLFPAFLRRLLLLALPCAAAWYAWALLPQGLWIPLAPLAALWLLFCVALFCLRPVEKGLFGRTGR